MANYTNEKDGQIDFFNMVLPRISSSLSIDDILGDNNDGVINGNLLEFKLNIPDRNVVLFQSIKYLSARRLKGKPVPATIHLIDLNASLDYVYFSEEYLDKIEKVYSGAASKDNAGFIGNEPSQILNYCEQAKAEKMIILLKENKFTKIHIDENCIVGWATTFYNFNPKARKEDFIGDDTGKHKVKGEIRRPNILVNYIYPYTDKTNIKFNYLMDKLNDFLNKKNLGAFYTHPLYAEKSLDLVREAIKRVPKGNDYIILDRCAGTGNLESSLTDEELSHCIVSTVEYYEYKVLQELLGSKVRHIIPPIEDDKTFNMGFVSGANALSEEYVNNPIIKDYIDNPNCTIILFENPPYTENTSIEHQKRKASNSTKWKQSFVATEMKKEIKGTALNDLGNLFIWSAFKYYLRQDTDSYIVYSPVKYWKAQHLISKEFIDGFAFNRRHFHTNIDACIMCALWSNKDSTIKEFNIDGYDIIENRLVRVAEIPIRRIFTKYSSVYYDKRIFDTDLKGGLALGFDGKEKINGKIRLKPITNDNIIGYLTVETSGFDNPDLHSSLLSAGNYGANGFYLRKDNYLEKLPMFAASRYITYNREWTERARIMKSADGASNFIKDVKNGKLDTFLRKCLLFTCLEMQNHMRTFQGSDGRMYRNELCLDTSNGQTLASQDIKKLKLNILEQKLLNQWNILLTNIKKTKEYNSNITYGIYQIYDEIDTYYKDTVTGDKIYNNIGVHTALQGLKVLVKEYYNKEIVPTLFKYEFLK